MAQTRTIASRNKNNILSGIKFINTVENEKINLKDETILSNLKELRNKLNRLLMEQVSPVETVQSFECALCFEDFPAEIGKCVFVNCCNIKLCMGCYGKSIASQGKKLYEYQLSPDRAFCCPFCTKHMVKGVEMKDRHGRFLGDMQTTPQVVENTNDSGYQGAYVFEPNSITNIDPHPDFNALYPNTTFVEGGMPLNSLTLASFHQSAVRIPNQMVMQTNRVNELLSNHDDESEIPELISNFGEDESTTTPEQAQVNNDSLDSNDSGPIPVDDENISQTPEQSWVIDRIGDPEVRRMFTPQTETAVGVAPNAPLRTHAENDNVVVLTRVRNSHLFTHVAPRSHDREERRMRIRRENIELIMRQTNHSRETVEEILDSNDGNVVHTIQFLNSFSTNL